MISTNVDTSGIDALVGGVDGILNYVESPEFEGDFGDYVLGNLRDKFRADTIASHLAGNKRIAHMFEWPSQDARGVSTGSPSSRPLFALYKTGRSGMKTLSYKFLPSTVEVPLPDPGRYGFPASKLTYMSRHTFRMKALVMETQQSVMITPKGENKLFIPDAENPRGYFMASGPTSINPGGAEATGGFAEWWNGWFEGRAPAIVEEDSRMAEQTIAATGRKVIRYAAGTVRGGKNVGGQFASATTGSVGYVNAARRNGEAWMRAAAKSKFNDEGEWEE